VSIGNDRRYPAEGDLITVKATIGPTGTQRYDDGPWTGIIYNVSTEGGYSRALIYWNDFKSPNDYNTDHGYACINIHNYLGHTYELRRNGKDIV